MTHLYLASISDFVIHQFEQNKTLITTIAIGLVCGLIAQMLLPGKGFGLITTILIGCAGAWLGTKYIKRYVTFVDDPFLKYMTAAIIGAMALVVILNLFSGKHDRDKTHWKHG